MLQPRKNIKWFDEPPVKDNIPSIRTYKRKAYKQPKPATYPTIQQDNRTKKQLEDAKSYADKVSNEDLPFFAKILPLLDDPTKLIKGMSKEDKVAYNKIKYNKILTKDKAKSLLDLSTKYLPGAVLNTAMGAAFTPAAALEGSIAKKAGAMLNETFNPLAGMGIGSLKRRSPIKRSASTQLDYESSLVTPYSNLREHGKFPGSKSNYAEYLDTKYPDSKDKSVLYHWAREPFDVYDASKRKARSSDLGEYINLSADKNKWKKYAEDYGRYDPTLQTYSVNKSNLRQYDDVYSARVNHPGEIDLLDALKTEYDGVFELNAKTNKDQFAIFSKEDYMRLGSKQDYNEFTHYMKLHGKKNKNKNYNWREPTHELPINNNKTHKK